MSTVGDETTYTFSMLDTPRDEVETISQLVYATHQPAPHPRKKKEVVEEPVSAATTSATEDDAPTMPAPVKK